MNVILHFLLGYLMAEVVFGNALNYILYIFVFSLVIDLDHIPYLLKVRKGVLRRRFGSESRTRFHELYGLALVSAGACILFPFVDAMIVKVAALCLVLHYAADFLLGKTRPFYPFSGREVSLFPQKHRVAVEVILTLVLGAIWISVISWAL